MNQNMQKESYTFRAWGKGLNIEIPLKDKEDLKLVKETMKRIKYNLENEKQNKEI